MSIIGCGVRRVRGERLQGREHRGVVRHQQERLDKNCAAHPTARRYVDFRKLLAEARHRRDLRGDGGAYTHAFATLWALQQKKHVCCEAADALDRRRPG
jgi:hypothetical protein